jgi:hypothetical protein
MTIEKKIRPQKNKDYVNDKYLVRKTSHDHKEGAKIQHVRINHDYIGY